MNLISFNEEKHTQVLDGRFQQYKSKDGFDVHENSIQENEDLIVEWKRLLREFKHERFCVDLTWDDEFEYHYPSIVNWPEADFVALDTYIKEEFFNSLEIYMDEHNLYYW